MLTKFERIVLVAALVSLLGFNPEVATFIIDKILPVSSAVADSDMHSVTNSEKVDRSSVGALRPPCTHFRVHRCPCWDENPLLRTVAVVPPQLLYHDALFRDRHV